MEKIYHHFPPQSDFILFHHKAQRRSPVCREAGRVELKPAQCVFKATAAVLCKHVRAVDGNFTQKFSLQVQDKNSRW